MLLENCANDVTLHILAIDIGLTNMGVVFGAMDYNNIEVYDAKVVDITTFNCGADCTLKHERMSIDWVHHFLHSYRRQIEKADVILLERQPPGGFRDVEQLLYQAMRSKTTWVHPRKFHAHFKCGNLTYDERKAFLCRYAKTQFADSAVVTAALQQKGRVHDIADALLFILMFWNLNKSQLRVNPRVSADHFDQFRYTPRKSRNTSSLSIDGESMNDK